MELRKSLGSDQFWDTLNKSFSASVRDIRKDEQYRHIVKDNLNLSSRVSGS